MCVWVGVIYSFSRLEEGEVTTRFPYVYVISVGEPGSRNKVSVISVGEPVGVDPIALSRRGRGSRKKVSDLGGGVDTLAITWRDGEAPKGWSVRGA